MITESNIKDLVARLPECYQPIFNFRQLDEAISRQCDDRLEVIRAALQSLVKLYGRPLRVLDLGCAQGFFSMSVADLCESVLGIDYLAANIDVCNAARDAAGLSHVRFQTGEISEFISALEPGQFDVVFGLSVFHHLCHNQGWPVVARQLKQLASVADVLMLELADAREPLYWAPSLPADPVELVSDIGFIYPLGVFPTHLGDVARSLYFCSDRIWHLKSSTRRFDRWTEQSHEFAGAVHQGTRRYFFAPDSVAKTIRFVGMLTQHNRREFANEEHFFVDLAPRIAQSVPTLELQSIGSTPEYGHVVTARVAGKTLAEMIVKGVDFNEAALLRQVLGQLAQLETHGLYHRDVRVWNIMVDHAGVARLLDPAAISEFAGDDSWPFHIYASFLIFVGELTSKTVPRVHMFRRPILSSAWLREPYRAWFDAIWAQSHREWSFGGFLALLDVVEHEASATPSSLPMIHADNSALWRAVSERLLSDATDVFHVQRDTIAARATREELEALEHRAAIERQAHNEALEAANKALANADSRNIELIAQLKVDEEGRLRLEHELTRQTQQHNVQTEQLNERLIQTQAALAEQQSAVVDLHRSTFWRLTAPLRAIVRVLRPKD